MLPENADRRPRSRKAAIQEQAGQPTHTITDPDVLLTWIDAYLLGWQRGYDARLTEERAEWPPAKVLVLGRWFDQAAERRKWDERVRREVAS